MYIIAHSIIILKVIVNVLLFKDAQIFSLYKVKDLIYIHIIIEDYYEADSKHHQYYYWQ